MSGKLRIPRTTIRFRDERGIVLVSLDDLLLWLAECELANEMCEIMVRCEGQRGYWEAA